MNPQSPPTQSPLPNFDAVPAGAHRGGSLDGHVIGQLRQMNDQLANILALSREQVRIVQEVPSDVGGVSGGNAILGTQSGNRGQGMVEICTVWGQAARYRTAFLSCQRGTYFGTFATASTKLGAIARLRFTVGSNTQYSCLFDIPQNAIIHAACLSQNMQIDVGLTPVVFTPSEITALFATDPYYFDAPNIVQLNSDSSSTTCTVQVGITENQSLAPNPFNTATRHITVILGAGDSVSIPIVQGAVAVQTVGPTDLVTTLDTQGTATNLGHQHVASNSVNPVTILNGAETITISSTTGGYASIIFTLGF